MSDLVKELRARDLEYLQFDVVAQPGETLYGRAAAEIERLTDALSTAEETGKAHGKAHGKKFGLMLSEALISGMIDELYEAVPAVHKMEIKALMVARDAIRAKIATTQGKG